MWWIWSLLIGFVIGLLAKALMPGRDPGGFIVTTLFGIVGAVVAAWLGRVMGIYLPGEPAGFIASVLGAMLLLFVFRKLRVGRAHQ